MKETNPRVFVSILDKDYQVACPPEERDALMHAAADLDRRMREIRGSGHVVGLDRIAVMAALNLCHELHECLASRKGNRDVGPSLERMAEKLDRTLKEKR